MPHSLSRLLRNLNDPDLRLQAARELSESDVVEAAPLLIRAAVEDPDARVRSAAHEALTSLIGAEADLAIKTYRSAPDEDSWLIDLPEHDGLEQEDQLTFEEDQYLAGVISALRNHPDPKMRLKAVIALEDSNDMRVIAALAETVLWTDDPKVKTAARDSLERRFGDETDEIIQTYQVQDYADLEEDDELEGEDEDEDWQENDPGTLDVEPGDRYAHAAVEENNKRWQAPVVNPVTSQQVVRDEGFPWVLVLIALTALAGMGVIVWLLVR